MKIVGEFKQNSPEWHEWRKEGIGASEANIIMGKSKFMTRKQLWEQKVFGKRNEDDDKFNFITDKGHRLEEKARPLFEMEIGYDFPDTIVIHPEFPMFRASLDGFNEEIKSLWECKFVGQADFETVKGGMVIDHYYPQLQHQLMVTGADCNYLYAIADDKEKKEAGSSFPYKVAYVKVLPDDEYIEKMLLPELLSFWKEVQEKREPELMKLDVVDFSSDSEMASLLEQYRSQKAINDASKAEMDKLSKSIFKKLGKASRGSCGDIKFSQSKSEDRETFDYKAFEEKNGIPEGFSKTTKGRVTKRITFPKPN